MSKEKEKPLVPRPIRPNTQKKVTAISKAIAVAQAAKALTEVKTQKNRKS